MKIFKITLFTLLSILLTSSVFGQNTGEEYKASMNGWEVSLEKAIQMSNEQGKPILANFTGTDWCGWCIRLKKEVFTTDEFKKWAGENVILLELDFPRRFKLPDDIAKQNSSLAQAFGVRGYPTIWVFNISQNKETNKSELQGLAKSGYVAGGPNVWIKDLESKLNQNK